MIALRPAPVADKRSSRLGTGVATFAPRFPWQQRSPSPAQCCSQSEQSPSPATQTSPPDSHQNLAKALDPNNPTIFVVLSDFAIEHGDYVGGVRLAETALSLDARSRVLHNNMAIAYLAAGEPSKAIKVLNKGMRLDDRYEREYFFGPMARAHFMLGDDTAAIEWAHKALDANPNFTSSGAILAMAYARKGDLAKSRAAVAALMQVNPKFNLQRYQSRKAEVFSPAYREYWETKLLPAWRLAGLPE